MTSWDINNFSSLSQYIKTIPLAILPLFIEIVEQALLCQPAVVIKSTKNRENHKNNGHNVTLYRVGVAWHLLTVFESDKLLRILFGKKHRSRIISDNSSKLLKKSKPLHWNYFCTV